MFRKKPIDQAFEDANFLSVDDDKLDYAKRLIKALGTGRPRRTHDFIVHFNAIYETAYADRRIMLN